MKHTITLIPGDGIGPEVAGSVVKILETAGLDVEYVAVAPFDPPTLAAAVRVGPTRLIDNVPLTKEQS